MSDKSKKIYKKKNNKLNTFFCSLVTMLPTSVTKAAENSVTITQFTGDTDFYNSRTIDKTVLQSPNTKYDVWERLIYSKSKSFSIISEADKEKILDGLDGSTLCIRSIEVIIEVSGEVAKPFTPYLYVKNTTVQTWGYGNSDAQRMGCQEDCPEISGPGEYKITLTIDDTVKDCSDSIINGNTASILVTSDDLSCYANNPDAVITLKSITFNKEAANAADLTEFTAKRQEAKAARDNITKVKNIYKYDYYTASARSAVDDALNNTNSIKNTNTQEQVDAATKEITDALDKLIRVKDLWDACNTALEGKNKADYTADSWNALDAAVEAALALSDDDFADLDKEAALKKIAGLQKDVTDTAEALAAKSEDPVENPLITQLKDAISPYKNRTEESYTPETWADYKEARDAIQKVIDNPPEDLTEETVTDLIEAFNTAVSKMVLFDSGEAKAALKEVVDAIKAKAYKEADYTAESWKKFADALKLAEDYATSTQNIAVQNVNNAKDKLLQAEAGLKEVPKVDKEDGVYLDYSGSWKKQSKDNAMTGYVADGSSAKVSTDDWWMDITNMDLSDMEYPTLEVEYVANGDTLQIVYNTTGTPGWNDANPVITSGSESSGKFKVSLVDKKDMKYLFLSSDAGSLEIKKVKIYEDAAGAVTEAKKALDAAVSSANKLKKDDYTAESWAVLEKALEDAKKITGDSTVADINAAKKALDDAVKGLEKVATPSSSPSASPSVQPSATPSTQPSAQPTKSPDVKKPLKPGVKVVTGRLVYKVTKAATTKKAGALTVVGLSAAGKKVSKLSLPATATIYGYNYKVTKIGNNALKGAAAKSVAIGKNITAIPKGAFANCKKLTKLTVKAKLKSVKKGAFKGCKKTIVIKGSTKKNRKANIKLLKKSGYKKFK